jgi:uncharacterized lipoprotein YddW (UPF0748 family)
MKTTYLFVMLLLIMNISVISQTKQVKKNYLWLDAHANFERLGTEDGVIRILNKAKSVGFENIILDLRGIDGYVLYPSKIAPVLTEHEGYKRDPSFNYPEVVLKEARKLGLGVYFSMNVFAEGNKETHLGLGYKEHPEWQVQVYTKDGIMPISESKEEIAVFVNPVLPAVRNYELSIIEELLNMYKPDGIVLDRTRYPNISGDFSAASKEALERFAGEKIANWPADIYTLETLSGGKVNRIPGKYYKQWLEWRAKVIHDFFGEARERIKKISPKIAFADYVGSWYPLYYDVGVNWASDKYYTHKDYEWADSSYYHTGYAQYLDFLFVGNYFYDVTKEEAVKSHTPSPDSAKAPDYFWWYSVEGSADIATKAVDNVIPVYGSLWVHQYLEKEDHLQFVRAMQAALKKTDGLMIFDVSEIDEADCWRNIREVLKGN